MFKELFKRCSSKNLDEHKKAHELLENTNKRIDEIREIFRVKENELRTLSRTIIIDNCSLEDIKDLQDLHQEYIELLIKIRKYFPNPITYIPAHRPYDNCGLILAIFDKFELRNE